MILMFSSPSLEGEGEGEGEGAVLQLLLFPSTEGCPEGTGWSVFPLSRLRERDQGRGCVFRVLASPLFDVVLVRCGVLAVHFN